MDQADQDKDDKLELSTDALAALQDFYSEREEREKRFEDLKLATEKQNSSTVLSMEMFSENWNASQFWYSDETAITLAKQLLDGAAAETRIAVVSAPSVFIQLKNLMGAIVNPSVTLLEFDNRFSVLGDFIHYDYQNPLKLPAEMKKTYDRIICDPPFLSSDCQTKVALTVRWLLRSTDLQLSPCRLIVCTGERMEGLIRKLYPGVQTTTFDPQHAQDRLSNEFRCYANFECNAWSWR